MSHDPIKLADEILSNRYGNEVLEGYVGRTDYADVIRSLCAEICRRTCPNGFHMTIKSQTEWSLIAEAVNVGIDAHLEAFTKSTFDNGSVLVHPDEMGILIDRMSDIICKQSNEEFAAQGCTVDNDAPFEPSDELQEWESFLSDIIEVLCKKDED